jgi:PAS domain S-box-containing protein
MAEARELGTLLAASQEQFRSFMDHNPAYAYMKDESLRHIYANRPLLDGLGLSFDEFVGTTSRDIMSSEMGRRMDDADTAVLSGKADLLEVAVSVDIRGETRWFRDTKFAVMGPAGERRVGGIAMDVTEHKRAEHELQRQAQFESLLSDISASFVNVPPDQMDAAIAAALEQVGACLELDRCTYGHLSLDGTEVHVTHVWNRDPLDGVATSYAAADYPWFLTPFVTGQELLWSRSEGRPPASEAEIQLLEALGMQCFAGIPVVVGDDVVGCLAFISCTNPRPWNPAAVARLHLLSRIFGSAIERRGQDLELRQAYDEIRQLKEHLEACIRWNRSRVPTRRCCCWVRPESARSSWRGRFTHRVGAPTRLLSRSTVRRFRAR